MEKPTMWTKLIVDEAINFLIENLSDKGEIFVAFSGGKDSICSAELMKMSGLPYTLYYSFTGIDPPEIIRFIRKYYPKCVFLKPRRTFWRDLAVHLPPSPKIRWCCHLLKKEPGWKIPIKFRVHGIRREESSRRAAYGRINHYISKNIDHMLYYPVYFWKEYQIWDFIEQYKLPFPSLYDEGFDRVGCIICPFHSKKGGKEHKKYRDRWPKYFDLWEKSISNLYYKRVKQGRKMFYLTPDAFVKAWYENPSARWYSEEEDKK